MLCLGLVWLLVWPFSWRCLAFGFVFNWPVLRLGLGFSLDFGLARLLVWLSFVFAWLSFGLAFVLASLA